MHVYIRTDSVRRTRDGQGTTSTRAGARLAFTHTGPSTSPARVFSAAEIFHLGDLGSPGVYLGYEPCAMWVSLRSSSNFRRFVVYDTAPTEDRGQGVVGEAICICVLKM